MGVTSCTVLFVSKLITVSKVGEYVYPMYIPFVKPETNAYYAALAYQTLSAFNGLLSHMAADSIFFSMFAYVVYQTRIVGYRFSRLGNSRERKGNVRLDCMREIVELIQLKFEAEKYAFFMQEIYCCSDSKNRIFKTSWWYHEIFQYITLCADCSICDAVRFVYGGNVECNNQEHYFLFWNITQ